MKAIIMAGGKGTRIQPLTLERPKPMIPVLNEPILHHLICHCASQGVTEIILTTSYLEERIRNYFGRGAEYRTAIQYIHEEEEMGTAGGVKNAEKLIDETFIVLAGDHVTDIKLRNMLKFHEEHGGMATVALRTVDNPREYGISDISSDFEIIRFLEKPKKGQVFSNLVSMGIYIFEPEIFDYIEKGTRKDFAYDVIPRIIGEGKKIYGFLSADRWTDVGRPSSYSKSVNDLMNEMSGSVITGKVRMEDAYIVGPVQIGHNVVIGENTKVIGPVLIGNHVNIGDEVIIGPYSTIGNSVKIKDHSKLLSAKIFDEVEVEERTRLIGCIIDNEVEIGSECEIENLAVIGARTKLDDRALVDSEVRIWPDLYIESDREIEEDLIE